MAAALVEYLQKTSVHLEAEGSTLDEQLAILVEYLQKTSAHLEAEGSALDEQLLKEKVMPSFEEGIRRLSRGAPEAIRGQLKDTLEEFKVCPSFEADILELRSAVTMCLLIVKGLVPPKAKDEPEEAMVFPPGTRIPSSDEWQRLSSTWKFSHSYSLGDGSFDQRIQVDIRKNGDGTAHVVWFEETGGWKYQGQGGGPFQKNLTGSVFIYDDGDGKLVFILKDGNSEATVQGSLDPSGLWLKRTIMEDYSIALKR